MYLGLLGFVYLMPAINIRASKMSDGLFKVYKMFS